MTINQSDNQPRSCNTCFYYRCSYPHQPCNNCEYFEKYITNDKVAKILEATKITNEDIQSLDAIRMSIDKLCIHAGLASGTAVIIAEKAKELNEHAQTFLSKTLETNRLLG